MKYIFIMNSAFTFLSTTLQEILHILHMQQILKWMTNNAIPRLILRYQSTRANNVISTPPKIFNMNSEWSLAWDILQLITDKFYICTLYIFSHKHGDYHTLYLLDILIFVFLSSVTSGFYIMPKTWTGQRTRPKLW